MPTSGDEGDSRNTLEACRSEYFRLGNVEFAIRLPSTRRVFPRDGVTAELGRWEDTQLLLDTLGVVCREGDGQNTLEAFPAEDFWLCDVELQFRRCAEYCLATERQQSSGVRMTPNCG